MQIRIGQQADLDTRRSRTGTLMQLNGSTIAFRTCLQPTIAQSSTEAEIQACNEGARDLVWGRNFLKEIGIQQSHPSILFNDNQGALAISDNDMINRRSRHMDIKYLWVRDLQKHGIIGTSYCHTTNMIADILTKPLARPLFERLRTLLGVISLSTFPQFRSRWGVGRNVQTEKGNRGDIPLSHIHDVRSPYGTTESTE